MVKSYSIALLMQYLEVLSPLHECLPENGKKKKLESLRKYYIEVSQCKWG